jgi:hypothetical protein
MRIIRPRGRTSAQIVVPARTGIRGVAASMPEPSLVAGQATLGCSGARWNDLQ